MFNKTKTEEMTTSVKPSNSGGGTMSTSNSNTSNGPVLNAIGAGTSVEGIIKCDGDIRIDGHVKGTVHSKSKIVIGTTGAVEGDIICETADVSGKIFGSVKTEDMLYLKSTAYMEGDITTGKMVVEAGAKFNGNCRMGVKEIKPNEKPNASGATTTLQKEAV
jgi:cytoskeletal protein CcmA (bactofilin family)